MCRKLSFVLIILILSFKSFGQIKETEYLKHSVGMAAGLTTGYGMSYRFIPHNLGFQLTFAPFRDLTSSKYSYGVTFIYYLNKFENSNMYFYQSNNYYSHKKTDTFFEAINNGVGLGFEIITFKRISLNIMLGYGLYNKFTYINYAGEAGVYLKL